MKKSFFQIVLFACFCLFGYTQADACSFHTSVKKGICPMCYGAGTTIISAFGASPYSTYSDGQWYTNYITQYASITCKLCGGTGKYGGEDNSPTLGDKKKYKPYVFDKMVGRWECFPLVNGYANSKKRVIHLFDREGVENGYSEDFDASYGYWARKANWATNYKYHRKTATTGVLELYRNDLLCVRADVEWKDDSTFFCTTRYAKYNKADEGKTYLCQRTD